MNSHFLLLPALMAICPHQVQQLCLGHAGQGIEGTSKVGSVFGGPTPQNKHLFHLWVGLGSPPALRGALCLENQSAQKSYWLFTQLFSRARAKTALSLLTTGWKKQ